MSGHVWPDGGAWLDQPAVLIDAWGVIGRAMELARKGEPQEI